MIRVSPGQEYSSLLSARIGLARHDEAPCQSATWGSIHSKLANYSFQSQAIPSRTVSTTSNPPRNHLYLLRFFSDQIFKSLMTPTSPRFLPASLRTIHARGTFSSDVRPPDTPATDTSEIHFLGCAKRTFSISTGETCRPETFNVSLALSSKLYRDPN